VPRFWELFRRRADHLPRAFRRRHLVFLVLDVTFHSIVKLTVATTNTVFVKRLSRGYYEARGRVAILLPAGLLKPPANLPFS
jgi:hypothetical protein